MRLPLVPVGGEPGAIGLGPEGHLDRHALGELVLDRCGHEDRFGGGGVARLHDRVNAVGGVTGHVAQRAGAEIDETPPFERVIHAVDKGPHRRGADPRIPVQARRHFIRLGRPIAALRPDRAIGPGMEFHNVADGAALDELVGQTPAVAGVALVAHLRYDLRVLGVGRGQQLGLSHRPR